MSTLTTEAKPCICIVSHNAYGAMTGGGGGHIGGVEWQTSLTAKWLAERGYRVSMLTWDEGQEDDAVIDGVRVIKMCRRDAGVPGLRFFHPRWTSLVSAMRRADADLYYQNCAEYVTGQVAMWCRRNGRRFIYSVASNMDVDPQLPDLHTIRERVLYRYGLRHADRVIVQTYAQRERLREGFGVDSVVIPMPCPGPRDGDYVEREAPCSGGWRVLWVGRICKQKRPDRLLDLAEACPDLAFDLVGPASLTSYSQGVIERAAKVANVTVHGAVVRDGMPEFYRKAACLLCTSDYEGFPNTFLEAWSHGLPVVSMFDPDSLIAGQSLGAIARDAAGLVTGIRTLLESPKRWRQASENARRYYVENHAVDVVMPRFEQSFLDFL